MSCNHLKKAWKTNIKCSKLICEDCGEIIDECTHPSNIKGAGV